MKETEKYISYQIMTNNLILTKLYYDIKDNKWIELRIKNLLYPYANININSKYFKLQYNKDYCFITIFKNQNFYIKNKDGKIEGEVNWEKLHPFLLEMDKQVLIKKAWLKQTYQENLKYFNGNKFPKKEDKKMEKEYKFRSSPPIATFKKYSSKSVNKLIRHNFRIGIPENVNPEFTKYNFYYVSDKKEKIINDKGFELANNKRFELLKNIEEDWNKQQQKYSEAQKSTFKEFCNKHNTYIEVVLPATRQEWFEKMGICQFTDIQVWDKKTNTRKMGQLIPESINYYKLNEWVNIEINFMKQWMKNNLKTDIGYLYSTVHMDETTPHIHFGFIPISKVFSKKLNEERYIISNNRVFGGKKQLQKFNNYHANYLTKAGYEIEPGEIGGKGSYNTINFRQVKEFERNKLENEINNLFDEYRSTKDNVKEFNKIKSISDDYDSLIYEIKQYLKYENNFTDYEINQLTKYLDLAEKIKYYKIITTIPSAKESDFKNMSLIEQEFNEMVFKINPIMQKGYDLVGSLEREL